MRHAWNGQPTSTRGGGRGRRRRTRTRLAGLQKRPEECRKRRHPGKPGLWGLPPPSRRRGSWGLLGCSRPPARPVRRSLFPGLSVLCDPGPLTPVELRGGGTPRSTGLRRVTCELILASPPPHSPGLRQSPAVKKWFISHSPPPRDLSSAWLGRPGLQRWKKGPALSLMGLFIRVNAGMRRSVLLGTAVLCLQARGSASLVETAPLPSRATPPEGNDHRRG